MGNELTNPIDSDAMRRLAELEATNTALREALSSKNAHIAMLEERISNMSVELASSRAREDEQNLMLRQSAQVSMMPGDDKKKSIPAELIDDTDSKSASSPAQISSLSSSSHLQFQRRFSLPIPGRVSSSSGSTAQEDDDMNDNSTRSLTGVGGIIGNMIKLDRSDRSQNLRVDFPSGGRQMYRLRISDLTVDCSASEETACKQEEEHEHDHEEEGHQASASSQRQRRRPNRSTLTNGQHHTNSRLISSTVIFPMEDDDDSVGFE
eukprot:scaffold11206_cov89-Skeletonema_dohrnii-CCMP3373.AAC.5